MSKMQEIKDIKLADKTSASELVKALSATGFQASNIAQAVSLIEQMKKKKSDNFPVVYCKPCGKRTARNNKRAVREKIC